jgi:hypothetical protein
MHRVSSLCWIEAWVQAALNWSMSLSMSMSLVSLSVRLCIACAYDVILHICTLKSDPAAGMLQCNQFGSQEPGSNSTIKSFAKKNYGVTFPLMAKVDVNGSAGKLWKRPCWPSFARATASGLR